MIKFLVLQIKLGKITISDVPLKYRLDVEEELNKTNNPTTTTE